MSLRSETTDSRTCQPSRAIHHLWPALTARRSQRWHSPRTRLGTECAASGKGPLFDALFPAGADERKDSYEVISARLGVPVATLRSQSMRLRQRLGEIIRTEIAETVSSPEAYQSELESFRAAFGA